MKRTLSIAIDGRNLMHSPGGSATYLICALNELSARQPGWTFHLLTNRPLHPECERLIVKRSNVHFSCRSFTKIGLVWYCTQLYFILKELKPDFFWAPATLLPPLLPAGIRTMVTVNDMVPKDFPETMSRLNRWYSLLLFDRSIQTADVLLAISDYTASEVKRRYPGRRAQQVAVGCGVDQSRYRPIELSGEQRDELCRKYGIARPYILFVGTLEPRKNLEFLLKLAPQLAESGFSILIVGARGWGSTSLAAHVNQPGFPADKVVFAGYVPTDDLVMLYNCAAVYVSTSLNEGFGLPQLEAMNCGCPVVSPHNSAMIEVVEGAGETVPGWEQDQWCRTILGVIHDRERYRQLGFGRADRYDWSHVAATIEDALVAA